MKLLGCVSKIVSKKPLLLLLALVYLAPAFASDNGGVVESKGGARAEVAAQAPVDAWGAVEERAGSPRVAAGAGAGIGSETVELKIAGETLVVPQVALDQFAMLPKCAEWSQLKPAGQSLEKDAIFNAENLRVLLHLVQNQWAQGYSVEKLVDVVLLADYLLINDWQVLEPVLAQLRVEASPELAMKIRNSSSVLRLPFVDAYISLKTLEDVHKICWSPDASGYWVIFEDKRARRYNKKGEPLGGAGLANVGDIKWSPDGSSYWVRFMNCAARRYNQAGEQWGAGLANVRYINWSSDSSVYFVYFMDHTAIRYNQAGEQQGVPLTNIRGINWSLDGSGYWVHFEDRRAIRYNQAGEQQGEPLERVSHIGWGSDSSVYFVYFMDHTARIYNQAGEQQGVPLENIWDIKWSPESSSYWVIFRDRVAIRYNRAGEQQGEALENVEYIEWSPDGSSYWVIFRGGVAIRYNRAGEQQGETLERVWYIDWSPDGSSYWVTFMDRVAIRYNQAGEQQGEALTNVLYIAWSPDSLGYSVIFHGESEKLYKSIFNNLPLYEQMLVQYVINHKNSTGKTARLAKEYLDLLSPDTLKKLQAAGCLELFYQVGDYVGWFDINDAGVGDGAGAGAGVGAGSGASGSKDLDHDQVD